MGNYKKRILELLDSEDFIRWLVNPSDEQDKRWNEEMGKNDTNKAAISKARQLFRRISVKEEQLSGDDRLYLWKQIEKATVSRKRTFTKRVLIWSSSAAAVLFLLGGIALYHSQRGQHLDRYAGGQVDMHNQENVQLILSDGKVVELQEKNVELVYDKQGELNVLTEPDNAKGKTSAVLNQLIVPYGKTSSITLSDGTRIWVNSGSCLIYPVVFSARQREVFVEGEIYLEVARNEKQPFIVKTEQFDVNVLGTSFNVQAYGDMNEQSVVLAEGAVKIRNRMNKESLDLTPNDMYTYERASRQSEVRQVDIYDYVCWKYGFLHFDSERIENVLNRLERFYNVNIHYDTESIKNIIVSGKLDMKENPADVFNSIGLTAPLKFEIEDNNTINVKLKPKSMNKNRP
jgi:ferric-dicitrate binding protein FerR (iron transport regulator)